MILICTANTVPVIATSRYAFPMPKAFSLFELLITLAIIAILTTIGYPSYNQHISKSRRKQARVVMLTIANRLEKQFAQSGSYQHIELSRMLPAGAIKLPYHFALTKQSKYHYDIRATATATQSRKDHTCPILSLNERGERQPETCWH